MGRGGGMPGCLKVAQGLLEAALKNVGTQKEPQRQKNNPTLWYMRNRGTEIVRGLAEAGTQEMFHTESQHQVQ